MALPAFRAELLLVSVSAGSGADISGKCCGPPAGDALTGGDSGAGTVGTAVLHEPGAVIAFAGSEGQARRPSGTAELPASRSTERLAHETPGPESGHCVPPIGTRTRCLEVCPSSLVCATALGQTVGFVAAEPPHSTLWTTTAATVDLMSACGA